jgi:hypothetical protein
LEPRLFPVNQGEETTKNSQTLSAKSSIRAQGKILAWECINLHAYWAKEGRMVQ